MIIVIKLIKFINYAKYLKLQETARQKKGGSAPLMEQLKPVIYFL